MHANLAIFAGYGLISPETVARETSICCPFHGERHPSCSINLERGLFHCFVCGVGGTVIDFIRLYEQCSTLDALSRFIERTQVEERFVLPEQSVKQLREQRRTDLLAAYDVYRQALRVDWQHAAEHYLSRRGFTPETLYHFGCRIQAGTPYSVLLPIYEGKVFRGYVARRTDNGRPKYVNNRGFNRALVYDGQLVPGPVAIVEGKTDQMMAYQFGFWNVAVIFGWKITNVQMRKIAACATSLYAWTDNDEAGERGYLELCRAARAYAIPVLRPRFPDAVKDIAAMQYPQFVRFLYHTQEQQRRIS